MNAPQNFAKDTALQFALREMHRLLNRWQFWIVLAAITAILAVSGPFNTLQEMSFAKRFAYWAAIAILTSLPSFTIAFIVNRIGQQNQWSVFAKIAVAGAVASIPVSLVVWTISAFIAQNGDASVIGFFEIAVKCMPIAIGITAIYTLLHAEHKQAQTGPVVESDAPFLTRLNPATGRTILTLQAQDHYVEVVTTRGKEMVLIRLEDAVNELSGIEGLRVHRSWWVSKAGAKALVRKDGKLVIETTDNRQLPVSRSNEKNVRQWIGNG